MKKLPIVVLLGLLALACSCGSDGREASEMPSEDTIPMITQLQACSRLYTTEYQIRTIVTHSDTTQFRGRGLLDGLRVGVPLSSRHIAIPIDATVKGYVDMADLTERNIRQEGNRLTVILPDPRVELTATKVDHKQTRQFVRFLGRNFTDAERSSFERQGRDSIIASLPQSGIIENARASAARILVPLLTQMGYKEEDITITFRKEFTGDDLRRNFTDAERSSFERQGRDSIIASLPQSGIIENARASAARILVPLLTQMGYKEEDITITFRKEFTGDDLRRMITTITQEKRP